MNKELEQLLYCLDGRRCDLADGNKGDADEWIRNIDKAYSDYVDSKSNDRKYFFSFHAKSNGNSGNFDTVITCTCGIDSELIDDIRERIKKENGFDSVIFTSITEIE